MIDCGDREAPFLVARFWSRFSISISQLRIAFEREGDCTFPSSLFERVDYKIVDQVGIRMPVDLAAELSYREVAESFQRQPFGLIGNLLQ